MNYVGLLNSKIRTVSCRLIVILNYRSIAERGHPMTRFIARARAPLRLGLAGGGTDVAPYSDEYGGLALNVTIDRFAYASIVPRDDARIEFVAADTNVRWVGDVSTKLPMLKGLGLHVGVYNRIVKDFNGGQPLSVSVTTHCEAPPGSGLGSSST